MRQATPGSADSSTLRTWLRRIATNEAYNSRRRTLEQRSQTGTLREVAVANVGTEGVASRQVLVALLAQLPYSYREIPVLRFVEALSLNDTSRGWGCPR